MNRIIICMRDEKTESFGTPQFVKTRGEAIRMLSDVVNGEDKSSALAAHPEDFSLWELGTFNEDDGRITPHELPQLVQHAKDLLR